MLASVSSSCSLPETRAIRGDLWQRLWAWLSYGAVQLAFRRRLWGLLGAHLQLVKQQGRTALEDWLRLTKQLMRALV